MSAFNTQGFRHIHGGLPLVLFLALAWQASHSSPAQPSIDSEISLPVFCPVIALPNNSSIELSTLAVQANFSRQHWINKREMKQVQQQRLPAEREAKCWLELTTGNRRGQLFRRTGNQCATRYWLYLPSRGQQNRLW